MIFRLCLCWLFLSACGGAPAQPEPAEASAGAEQVQPPVAEPVPEVVEETPEPPASGPSTLTVKVMVKDKAASASVKLLDQEGGEVASGAAGEPLTAPSGDYTLLVQLGEDSPLVDQPRERRSLTLLAGGDITETLSFPWSRVKLLVKVNGTLDRKASVVLLRQGAAVKELGSDQDYVLISPGRYDADVKTRGAVIRVTGLLLPEGGTRDVPVSVSL